MRSPCYCTTLRTATRKLSSDYDAALAPLGINIAQYSLMRRIVRSQPISLTELGRTIDLDRSTIGRNVRVLERMRLVKTARGDDQREAVVRLSQRGEAILEQARPVWERCQHAVEAKLGPEKLKRLGDLLAGL